MTEPSADDEERATIERVLDACFAALAEGREPDLDRLCGNDADLRARVEALLEREVRHVNAARSKPVAAPTGPSDATEPGMSLPPRLGDFSIGSLIGQGGMGFVYRARQESLGRDVALKVLRADSLDDDAAVLRFRREANVTAALDHPNIVPVYATATERGFTYLAMKLLRGHSLDQGPRPLPPHDVASLGASIAGALECAHEVGVLHRDVKPGNIFIENGVPYLLDFGLARIRGAATALTQQRAAPGTLAYMAPELLSPGAAAYDPRIDVYGLGVTMYELLAGSNPFDGESPIRAIRNVLFREPPRLGLSGQDRDLETIVLRCLDKAPQRRFSSAQALADDLQRYLSGAPIESRPAGPATRLVRRARRHPWTAAMALAAAVVLGAFLAMWIGNHLEQRDRTRRQVVAIEERLAAEDPKGTRDAIERLRDESPDHDGIDGWLADARALELTRDLLILLQAPEIEYDPELVTPLTAELQRSPSAWARRPGVRAVLFSIEQVAAREDRLARDIPQLPEDLAIDYPMLARVVDAHRAGGDLVTVLASPTQNALDALLARLCVRSLGQRIGWAEWRIQVPPRGIERDAVRYAQAMEWALQDLPGRAVAALGDVVGSPTHGALALVSRAQLEAEQGRLEVARQDWQNAVQRCRDLSHLKPIVELGELDLLRQAGETAVFWRRWDECGASLGRQPQYWVHGVLAAFDEGDFERVIELAERGGASVSPGPARLDFDARVLEAEFALLGLQDYQTLDAAPSDPRRETMASLVRRGTELAARAESLGVRDSRGLLVAARARRARGDIDGAWDCLERACRVHGDAPAYCDHAIAVALRLFTARFDPTSDRAEVPAGGSPLDAAALAVERGLCLFDERAPQWTSNRGYRARAQLGIFVAAYFSGRCEVALRTALELGPRIGNPDFPEWNFGEAVASMTTEALERGGLDPLALAQCDDEIRDARVEVVAQRAIDAIRTGQRDGWLQRSHCETILDTWSTFGEVSIPAECLEQLRALCR